MNYTTARKQIDNLPHETVSNLITTLFWPEHDLTMNQQKIRLVDLMTEYNINVGELKDEADQINNFNDNWN